MTKQNISMNGMQTLFENFLYKQNITVESLRPGERGDRSSYVEIFYEIL